MAATGTVARARTRNRATTFRPSWAWLGVAPFALFIIAFLLYPAASIVTQALRDQQGQLTLHNIANLRDPFVLSSYRYTIMLSAVSALGGGILG